ncbi:hypothetical protein AK812_SmicGene20749 [Symbiodinium microadriaticum]|uniref:Uncharacterized protein n=1 Tax=Symbiodinium microadriaticum TaxID=2951 RepID=A0A1Q9DP56_SYMMI|nr:hypothetical protein AK812_SmicGene20749 [Symbiodinium microadriaticum]
MELNVTDCVPDQEGEDAFRVVTDLVSGAALQTGDSRGRREEDGEEEKEVEADEDQDEDEDHSQQFHAHFRYQSRGIVIFILIELGEVCGTWFSVMSSFVFATLCAVLDNGVLYNDDQSNCHDKCYDHEPDNINLLHPDYNYDICDPDLSDINLYRDINRDVNDNHDLVDRHNAHGHNNKPIGATQLAVDSTLGFSIGRVEIINITYEVRRLEAVDKDFFAKTDDSESEEARKSAFRLTKGTRAAWRRLNADGTVAILDVTPPVERAYPAGTRIINAGPAISYTGGQKFKFWFPLHEEMLMLQTPELRIYGQVFPGPELGLQWFGHLRVLRTDGTPVARASWLRRCSSRKLDSLDVFLGKDVRFELNCRQQARPQLASSRTEYLHFETPSIAFLIVAAHAGNEFPNDAKLALKYKHLAGSRDFLILEMPRKETFTGELAIFSEVTGVLPEIWGLVPRSPAVEAMQLGPRCL